MKFKTYCFTIKLTAALGKDSGLEGESWSMIFQRRDLEDIARRAMRMQRIRVKLVQDCQVEEPKEGLQG